MSHIADPWIASKWQGQPVRQIAGLPDCIGRIGKVEETKFDEKGALHCRMTGGWWCPAAKLEIMDRGEIMVLAMNDSQVDLTWLL